MSDKEKVSGEEVEVVGFSWLNTAHFRRKIPTFCIPEHWNALMTAAQHQRITEALRGELSRRVDVSVQLVGVCLERDQLRAEVERLNEQLMSVQIPVRCKCCGYLVTDREHLGCLRIAEQLAQQQVPGWKLVPVEPTPEMVSAAEEAHMPFGDMDIALRMAILSAPSAPKADDPVKVQLLEALEAAEKKLCIAEYHLDKGEDDSVVFESEILLARAAIAAARKGEGE